MSTHVATYRPPSSVTMGELFPNHDGLRPVSVPDLRGRDVVFWVDGGPRITARFGETEVRWRAEPAPDALPSAGTAAYEAVPVRDGILAVILDHAPTRTSALVVVDETHRRALAVVTRMLDGERAGEVVEDTRIFSAGVDEPLGRPFAPTHELVGRRVHWRYSDTHSFEHIYLSDRLYCWHGLEGPEADMGGVEPTSARAIADDLVLFTWSDTSVPFNGAIVIDFAAQGFPTPVHSTGRLVGWDDERAAPWHIVVGAHGTLVNETSFHGL